VNEQSLSARLRAQRTATVLAEVETVALRLFEDRGFDHVTVAEIAAEAQISTRTFYGYFPAKEDVFQVRIERIARALETALKNKPADERPLHYLRIAITEVYETEDPVLLRQWTSVIANEARLARSVLGGVQQQLHPIIIGFLTRHVDATEDAILAGAYAGTASGIIQATLAHWYVHGGDLVSTLSENLMVLERFDADLSEGS
jgi:AcrR family transcriptional regulator